VSRNHCTRTAVGRRWIVGASRFARASSAITNWLVAGRHFHAAHARLRIDQGVSRDRASVPLIAMSGYVFADHDGSAPDFLRMALELGAARCLRKPFTPDALLVIINECLREGEVCSRGPLAAGLR
jgi:hypothetical protein